MAYVEEKKALLKEIQSIAGLVERASQRAYRLSHEFNFVEPEDCPWNKDIDLEKLSDWFEDMGEACNETFRTMELIQRDILNGTHRRGDGSRS